MDDLEPIPPGEELSGLSDSIIKPKLDAYKELPLIGLEYLVEISGSRHEDPVFKCLLCKTTLNEETVISDLTSTDHRLAYLRLFFPTAYAKFLLVPKQSAWQKPTFDFLESVISQIESRFGRLNPMVLKSKEMYDHDPVHVSRTIENGPHFRQVPDCDFRKLPDPFGSYRNQLKPEDMSKHGKGLGHIEDPDMQCLVQREIKRFRERAALQTPAGGTEGDSKSEEVMSKLAAMRASLNREERELYEKYRAGVQKPTQEEGRSDISDDVMDVVDNTDNEPENGAAEAQSLTRKSRKLARFRPDKGQPDPDYGRSRPRGSPGRGDGYPSERRSRSRDRDRDRRPRSTSRDRGRRPRSSSRDRGRRMGRSPERRSHRSRSPRPMRSRSRSLSPFSAAHTRWSRFTMAHRVMLKGIERKKEIFDKRPEDHPAYPEEWRLFWEKRYKELQDEGKDADNYDYKEDWIPFWEKRIAEIFEEEVKQKTDDLLKKYELESADEPKRPEVEEDPKRHYDDDRVSRGPSMTDFVMDFDKQGSRGDRRGGAYGDRGYSPRRSPTRRTRSGRSRSRSRERYRRSRSREPYPRSRSRSRERERDYRGGRSWSREGHGRLNDPFAPMGYQEDRRRSPEFGRDPYGSSRYKISPDEYSGLSTLERMRDSGRSGRSMERLSTGFDDVQPHSIIGCLRLLTALEDLLGSLAPQITVMMTRSLALENNREGASNLLLEDKDVAAILEMTKEKLAGLIVAGLLSGPQENAVRSCIDRLQTLLARATKKRPINPPNLLAGAGAGTAIEPVVDEKTKFKQMFAELLAKQLMSRGQADISDYELHKLVFAIAEKTDLDDGTLAPPPPMPPPMAEPRRDPYGGYAAAASHPAPVAEPPKPILEDLDFGDSNLDDFDELTMEELRSLLDNFKNLSKTEQMDLVQYMRKLETTDPEKVKRLKNFSADKSADSLGKAKPRSPQHNHTNYYEDTRSNPPPPPPPDQPQMFRSMGSFPGPAPPAMAANPLASVLGAINAPPPPPPPSQPPYGQYQPPPPPPPDDYGYGQYQPPPQSQYPGGHGLLGPPPPPGGSYGNYSSYPPYGNYGANPGPPPPNNGNGYMTMGGPRPNMPPEPRSLGYYGANQPPAANPLFKHLQGYEGGNF